MRYLQPGATIPVRNRRQHARAGPMPFYRCTWPADREIISCGGLVTKQTAATFEGPVRAGATVAQSTDSWSHATAPPLPHPGRTLL